MRLLLRPHKEGFCAYRVISTDFALLPRWVHGVLALRKIPAEILKHTLHYDPDTPWFVRGIGLTWLGLLGIIQGMKWTHPHAPAAVSASPLSRGLEPIGAVIAWISLGVAIVVVIAQSVVRGRYREQEE